MTPWPVIYCDLPNLCWPAPKPHLRASGITSSTYVFLDPTEIVWHSIRFTCNNASVPCESTMPDKQPPTNLTDESFDREIVQSSTPVLLAFWAEWSGNCHIMEPVLESIAQTQTGRLKVVRTNIDNCPTVAARFGVITFPTLLLFQFGELVDQATGTISRIELEQRLQVVLVTPES